MCSALKLLPLTVLRLSRQCWFVFSRRRFSSWLWLQLPVPICSAVLANVLVLSQSEWFVQYSMLTELFGLFSKYWYSTAKAVSYFRFRVTLHWKSWLGWFGLKSASGSAVEKSARKRLLDSTPSNLVLRLIVGSFQYARYFVNRFGYICLPLDAHAFASSNDWISTILVRCNLEIITFEVDSVVLSFNQHRHCLMINTQTLWLKLLKKWSPNADSVQKMQLNWSKTQNAKIELSQGIRAETTQNSSSIFTLNWLGRYNCKMIAKSHSLDLASDSIVLSFFFHYDKYSQKI